jgi:hypothetical protein
MRESPLLFFIALPQASNPKTGETYKRKTGSGRNESKSVGEIL